MGIVRLHIHHACILLQIYFQILNTSYNNRIYTLVHSCTHGSEVFALSMNNILYQVYFQVPKVVIMKPRDLYMGLRSVKCTLTLAMDGIVYELLEYILYLMTYVFLSHVYPF